MKTMADVQPIAPKKGYDDLLILVQGWMALDRAAIARQESGRICKA